MIQPACLRLELLRTSLRLRQRRADVAAAEGGAGADREAAGDALPLQPRPPHRTGLTFNRKTLLSKPLEIPF